MRALKLWEITDKRMNRMIVGTTTFCLLCMLIVADVAKGSQDRKVLPLTPQPVHVENFQRSMIDASASSVTQSSYGAYDDFSWAIMNDDSVSTPTYQTFMKSCARVASQQYCASQERWRMQMNMYQTQSVYNYTETGFTKTRAPNDLFQLVRSFFDRNKHESSVEWSELTTFHNNWEVPTRMVRVDNETLIGGGQALYATIADAIRPLVEEWIGMRVAVTSVYGVRIYGNQSILAPHVDRLPLVSSVIMNIDQDVDEDWPLEVFDHDGIAHNITMQPGDIVYYESATVIHGRPFPLNGKFYANIFMHFEPIAPLNATEPAGSSGLPPYLVPGSSWEPEWREMYPKGWELLNDPWTLADRGDLYTLQYIASFDPMQLHRGDREGWTPLFSAIRKGHLNVVKFLLQQGVDVNALTGIESHRTPLDAAVKHHGTEAPVSKYLRMKGAVLAPIVENCISLEHSEL
ncbi:hypothetical protein MPSEU_000709200 [Mayamaea pseudoterrestris]|nr:hypothetical protein MPSEU_000709200 [Mayamaea pseudoterrestris]